MIGKRFRLPPFIFANYNFTLTHQGLSEATLDQLIRLGALKGYQDLYHLDRHREEITALESFGAKSYEKMIASINESRNTTFVRFVVAMDIS